MNSSLLQITEENIETVYSEFWKTLQSHKENLDNIVEKFESYLDFASLKKLNDFYCKILQDIYTYLKSDDVHLLELTFLKLVQINKEKKNFFYIVKLYEYLIDISQGNGHIEKCSLYSHELINILWERKNYNYLLKIVDGNEHIEDIEKKYFQTCVLIYQRDLLNLDNSLNFFINLIKDNIPLESFDFKKNNLKIIKKIKSILHSEKMDTLPIKSIVELNYLLEENFSKKKDLFVEILNLKEIDEKIVLDYLYYLAKNRPECIIELLKFFNQKVSRSFILVFKENLKKINSEKNKKHLTKILEYLEIEIDKNEKSPEKKEKEKDIKELMILIDQKKEIESLERIKELSNKYPKDKLLINLKNKLFGYEKSDIDDEFHYRQKINYEDINFKIDDSDDNEEERDQLIEKIDDEFSKRIGENDEVFFYNPLDLIVAFTTMQLFSSSYKLLDCLLERNIVENDDYIYTKCLILKHQRKYKRALNTLEKINLYENITNEKKVTLLFLKAQLLECLGISKEAKSTYEKILSLDKDFGPARLKVN